MLPEDQDPLVAHQLRLQGLVGQGVHEDAVRVDARFMAKGVVPDDGLGDGHRNAREFLHKAGELEQAGCLDARIVAVEGL